jgi:dTDP-glucose pyrophosphorylase
MELLTIHHTMPIRQALGILDGLYTKTLFLVDDDGVLQGSLTDGDIRRWILHTGDIKGTAMEACNPVPTVIHRPFDNASVQLMLKEKHLQAVPVLNQSGVIESIICRDDIPGVHQEVSAELQTVPVVIMAGGKGTRLDPFTRILPKPLIPIGNQPVIEVIMQEFARFGANLFHISLNHKARLIRAYFEEQQYPYDIRFIEEDEPLGTAGALKMLAGKLNGDLFVSNCDVIIHSHYGDMLRFHRQSGFALTMVAAIHNQAIPYGVCEVDEKGHLKQITEKPEYSMLVNTGMYIMHSEVLQMIPENTMYHMTDLIAALQASEKPIGVFPVPANAYHDIGQWDAYKSALPHLTQPG